MFIASGGGAAYSDEDHAIVRWDFALGDDHAVRA
jgi:hypothetical protein